MGDVTYIRPENLPMQQTQAFSILVVSVRVGLQDATVTISSGLLVEVFDVFAILCKAWCLSYF